MRNDSNERQGRTGTVYLVGAGPGDPGLLTLHAARLIRRADLIIHDALIGDGIIDLASPHAEIVDVGKRCGGERTSQECINDELIAGARRVRTVVRLKGGDPFVFGRGGEEALALSEAGIRFRIVPGVTAGVGVSAYAGIPVTHRDLSSSVTFVTGHEKAGADPRVDWDAIARIDGTVVVYMGLGNLAEIADRLIGGGRSASTPAAVIEWGTVPRQKTVTAALSGIAEAAAEGRIASPALLVVGEVAALRERIGWFDRLPLRGRRIVVARSRAQPSRIAKSLARLGAEVIEYPRLRSAGLPLDSADARRVSQIDTYDWLLFAAKAAVEHFWEELERRGLDARALGALRIASFGVDTARALGRRGITPDVAERTFKTDAVTESLARFGPVAATRILLPRERERSSAIARDLRESGAVVDEIALFETRVERTLDVPEIHTADIAVLPSSSAASAFVRGLRGQPFGGKVVTIGPGTAETALGSGLEVDSVPDAHTFRGVVDAVRAIVAEDAHPMSAARPG